MTWLQTFVFSTQTGMINEKIFELIAVGVESGFLRNREVVFIGIQDVVGLNGWLELL